MKKTLVKTPKHRIINHLTLLRIFFEKLDEVKDDATRLKILNQYLPNCRKAVEAIEQDVVHISDLPRPSPKK